MKHKCARLLFFALLGLFIPNSGQAKDLSVVTSIRPIHSLVSGVMGDIAQPHLLITGGESPHTYAMKTSDAHQLQNADVVFWIGADFETFLDKAISSLSSDAKSVPLSEVPNLVRLPVRESGAWDADEHHHDDEIDMHVWLDPQNAIALVEAIALALSEVDQDNAKTYRRNAVLVIERLRDLTDRISGQLAGLEQRRFIQFHDAFQYLENRFSLAAVGAVTLNPERQVGAGRIRALRNRIDDEQIVCIFTEPQFEPKLVDVITEGLEVNVVSLDPVGVDFPLGADLYFLLMIRNSAALKSCLAG